ncbi:MAG TPA: MerR family transcriptional regulator [Puia sp.]|nr:MerR family transcriptional regulator [Puia sp.]
MAPTTPSGVETGSASQPPLRQYIEAAGVVVRFKSYKSAHKPQSDTDTAPEKIAAPPVVKLPAAEPENQLQIFGNEPASPAEPEQPIADPQPTSDPQPIAEPQHSRTEPQPWLEAQPRLDRRRAATPKPATPKAPSKRGRKSLKQVTAEADLIEVPADEVLFSKQYYTMGEVSEMFRVNQSLLRFWETEFDILQPRKNKKGDRYFRPVDIKNLHLIYHLLRQKKYTIEGAKEFLKKNKKADERFEVIQRLQEIRTFLLEWKAQL